MERAEFRSAPDGGRTQKPVEVGAVYDEGRGAEEIERVRVRGGSGTMVYWLTLGLVIGLGALLRQTLLLFAPLLVVGIVISSRERILRPSGTTIRGVGIAALAAAALVLPWTARNYVVYHDLLLLNSNGGFWTFSSNHPNQGTDFNGSYVAPIPAALKGLPEPAMDRALYRAGIQFILDDPKRFLLLSISRLSDYFWVGTSERSTTISNLGRILSFTLYWPFFLYGLLLSRKNWRACLPLYLYAAFDTLLCLATWSTPRYRLPTDAVMMPMAGLAVVDLATRLMLGLKKQPRTTVGSTG